MRRYPEIPNIQHLKPGPQILLGKQLNWQEKRDGSCIRTMLDDKGELLISSRNQDFASAGFRAAFGRTDEALKVGVLLKENWGILPMPFACDFNFKPIVFGELLTKGKSPTRIELHEKDEYVVFDIWDSKASRFLTYTQVHQICHHYDLLVVKLIGQSQHSTLEELYAFKDKMLEACKILGREGTVVKTFDGDTEVYAKAKNDTPQIEKIPREYDRDAPQLPPLLDGDILGAINRVHVDAGDKMWDKAYIMPIIAKTVNEEAKKHLAQPPGTLYKYYLTYLEGVEKNG